jgi:FkbH-like protein
MKRAQPIALTVVGALCFVSVPLLCASVGVAGIIYGVEVGLGLHTTPIWIGRVVAAPLIYLAWLLLMLAACAIELRLWQRLLGYRKPARITERNDRFRFYLILLCYMRQRIVWYFPLAQSFLTVEGLRQLVLWGAATRLRLGPQSFLFGFLYDPDLTEIGEGAILGGESVVAAHAITTMPDGDRVYVSAPVTIGPRATIGGTVRIDLGVRIGADAIVEPMSYVPPYTVIGAGEVWGGNPARFVRSRFETAGHISDSESLPAADEHALREIVADALGRPLTDVTSDLSAAQCASWDSLAQMAIGVALQQRFGMVVPAADSFRLRSMADIRALVDRARPSETGAGQPQAALPPVLPRNPELLPLMDHELATNSLAASVEHRPPDADLRELSIVVAATFTAEPLGSPLRLWSRAFGVSATLEFAGYNQVPQTLLSPDSAFRRNHTGVNLVLARPEDLLAAGTEESREQAVGDVLDAIAQFAGHMPGTLVVSTLPPAVSPFFSLDRRAVGRCRALWESRLQQIAGIELLDFAAVVERLGIDAARSADMEVVARAPYSAAVYRELGIEIARTVRRRVKATAKVLALDADGVLWGGVLAEDGIDGVHLGPDQPGRAFQLFQQYVLELKQRGILLVLVSRNTADDVWQMFERHPDMRLQRSDLAAARINWQAKSRNLREVAAELNVALDAFVFVDDDAANRLEVETNASGVVVVPLPSDAAEYCQTLSRLWCFDAGAVTAEDRERTAMIQQEEWRREGRAAANGSESYLASLGLAVEMRQAESSDLPRVAQLMQKTNQFNLSLKRRSLTEIQALPRDARVFVIKARDRFGEYGLVGACILVPASAQPGQFQIDSLLLSCRALGRGIEDALLYGVRRAVEPAGATRLLAPFVEGPRNQPIRDFLMRSGFREHAGGVFEHSELGDVKLPSHVAWTGP